MRNAKLIVPVIVVVALAALIGALAARSMSDSHKQAVVKTRMVSGKKLLASSIEACIQPSPPTRYGLNDSRVTLIGAVTTTLPPRVITLLSVNTPARLSRSKNLGAYPKSPSSPSIPALHHPTEPPKIS